MHPTPQRRPLRAAPMALSALCLLAACASPNPDARFAPVADAARQHLNQELRWARSDTDLAGIQRRVAELLSAPLSADGAVQLALLNNRGLQAQFQELGVTEAELVQATRWPNPGISLAGLARGDEREREFGLHLPLGPLLALPWLRPLQERRMAQTQTQAVQAVLALAAETRKAHVLALSAEEGWRYSQQVLQAAAASAELARRMESAGNFSRLQRAREQVFQVEAMQSHSRASQARLATRERLVRLLGLDEPGALRLPERLPDVPAQALPQPDVERVALQQRLDVQAARQAADATAQQLGLTRQTRFINVLELGVVRNRSNEAPTQRGWELRLELPLFDWGDARVARAESVYMQALHRTADAAVQARSEVREAYGAYRAAWAAARHHQDEILPLRKQIADENLLRYNGMQIGVFELLAEARAQVAGVQAALNARREFWLAQADLELALLGKPQLSPAAADSAAAPEAARGAAH